MLGFIANRVAKLTIYPRPASKEPNIPTEESVVRDAGQRIDKMRSRNERNGEAFIGSQLNLDRLSDGP